MVDLDIDIDIDKYTYIIYTCHHIVITKHHCYSFVTSYQISFFSTKSTKKVIPPGTCFAPFSGSGVESLRPGASVVFTESSWKRHCGGADDIFMFVVNQIPERYSKQSFKF